MTLSQSSNKINPALIENIKKDIEKIQELKKENPEEYKRRLKDFIDALKQYNTNARDLVDFYNNEIKN